MPASPHSSAIEYHDQLASQWDGFYEDHPGFQRRSDFLMSLVARARPAQGSCWLDAGCGTGALARRLAEAGHTVHGCDGAPQMIEEARRLASRSPRAEHLQFDIIDSVVELPYADESFDAALSSSVLEYLAEPAAALAELHRVLRPGGLLIVTVPNAMGTMRRVQRRARAAASYLQRDLFSYLEFSRHAFTRAEFESILHSAGFAVLHHDVFDPRIPRWAHRVFPASLHAFACTAVPERSTTTP